MDNVDDFAFLEFFEDANGQYVFPNISKLARGAQQKHIFDALMNCYKGLDIKSAPRYTPMPKIDDIFPIRISVVN